MVGTGNVAWHLTKAFHKFGIAVEQIVGRNEEQAKEIAGLININYTTDLSALKHIDGIYLIAVNDSAIADVAKQIYKPGRKLIHCGGGVNKNVLIQDGNKAGVFYPILSFNKNVEIDIAKAIICVDSNDTELTNALFALAKKMSAHVYKLNDEQRLVLNMSAVWVNNFSNHLFTIA
ncbi:MAG: NAD(P)-binding domain-containing protein, partial [Fimbriimonadaceae bacterium]|nr:NAD(P)-binding domain-containing protein [Chitinophagales bacterium]